MSSFSFSVRRSSLCFTVAEGGETNVMSSFSLSVRRSSVCFTVSNGEKQTSCHHFHCLYVDVCFSPLETVKHNDERRTDNENDDMTFVSPPLETVKPTDERRTDLSVRRSSLCFAVSNGGETNVMSSFSLSVRRSSVGFTVSNGEKQTSCHHSHCLYVVRHYVLLSLIDVCFSSIRDSKT
jgi:hypothetical protein